MNLSFGCEPTTKIETIKIQFSPNNLHYLSIDPGSNKSGILSTNPPLGIQIMGDKNGKWLLTIAGFLIWNFKYETVIIENFNFYRRVKSTEWVPIVIGKLIQLCEFFNTPHVLMYYSPKQRYQIPFEHINDAANLLGKWLEVMGIKMQINGWEEI